MTVAAACYWSFRETLDDQTEDNLAHCAGDLLDQDDNGWALHGKGMPTYLDPPGGMAAPAQEWKAHVSATSRSAPDVLTAVMSTLLRGRVPFKFSFEFGPAGSTIRKFLASRLARSSPPIPLMRPRLVRVAQLCDRATEGPSEQVILSDRAGRPGRNCRPRRHRHGHRHGPGHGRTREDSALRPQPRSVSGNDLASATPMLNRATIRPARAPPNRNSPYSAHSTR